MIVDVLIGGCLILLNAIKITTIYLFKGIYFLTIGIGKGSKIIYEKIKQNLAEKRAEKQYQKWLENLVSFTDNHNAQSKPPLTYPQNIKAKNYEYKNDNNLNSTQNNEKEEKKVLSLSKIQLLNRYKYTPSDRRNTITVYNTPILIKPLNNKKYKTFIEKVKNKQHPLFVSTENERWEIALNDKCLILLGDNEETYKIIAINWDAEGKIYNLAVMPINPTIPQLNINVPYDCPGRIISLDEAKLYTEFTDEYQLALQASIKTIQLELDNGTKLDKKTLEKINELLKNADSCFDSGSYMEARKYYEQVLRFGKNASAYTGLGYIYLNGKAGDRDLCKAKDCFKKACEMGDSDACHRYDELI